jgi:hypothetical protein
MKHMSAFKSGEQAGNVRALAVKNPYSEELDPSNYQQWRDGYEYSVLTRMRAAMGGNSKMRFQSTSNELLTLDMKIAALEAVRR